MLCPSITAPDPEQKSNAADKAFPQVPIDQPPSRHAVRGPVPQGHGSGPDFKQRPTAKPALLSEPHDPGRCRVCRFSAPTWDGLVVDLVGVLFLVVKSQRPTARSTTS